jgi:hypothetical protein
MLTEPVPDFFQEDSDDALRGRVRWLEAEIGLGAPFFARLLRTDEEIFLRWQEHQACLPREVLFALREVWELMRHILSFVNFDCARARQLLEHVPPPASSLAGTGSAPPWVGSSIKNYLETHGIAALDDVSRWVTSFRFGTPILTPEVEVPCPSFPD